MHGLLRTSVLCVRIRFQMIWVLSPITLWHLSKVFHLKKKKKKPWLVWFSGWGIILQTQRFDSWSGHRPGLRARSPAGGVQEATNVFLPLFFPPFALKINNFKNHKMACGKRGRWWPLGPECSSVWVRIASAAFQTHGRPCSWKPEPGRFASGSVKLYLAPLSSAYTQWDKHCVSFQPYCHCPWHQQSVAECRVQTVSSYLLQCSGKCTGAEFRLQLGHFVRPWAGHISFWSLILLVCKVEINATFANSEPWVCSHVSVQ